MGDGVGGMSSGKQFPVENLLVFNSKMANFDEKIQKPSMVREDDTSVEALPRECAKGDSSTSCITEGVLIEIPDNPALPVDDEEDSFVADFDLDIFFGDGSKVGPKERESLLQDVASIVKDFNFTLDGIFSYYGLLAASLLDSQIMVNNDTLLLPTASTSSSEPKVVDLPCTPADSCTDRDSLSLSSTSLYDGRVQWANGQLSKISLNKTLSGIQRGKIYWDDGSSSEVVIDTPLTSGSQVPSVRTPGVDHSLQTHQNGHGDFSADSPPQMAEEAVGLVLVNPSMVRSPPMQFLNIHGTTNLADNLFQDVMWSSMLMHHGSSEGSSKIAIKRLGRNPPGRPRKIAPLVTSPVYEGRYSPKSFAHPRASVPPKKLTQSPIKPKRKSSIPQKRDWDGMSTELLEDPVVMGEGTEEPAVCKRCHLNVAGIDHFDRQHNGLLMEEQNSFTVQEKRARWNGIIKKKMKLRCQNFSCQKTVNSSTAMAYHEKTCGQPVAKEECPQCRHLIARSYLHQHMMNHNRQAGVYTRPRKKTSMADSSPLMLLKQSSSSKRKFGGESGTESVPSPSQRIKLSEESEGEVAGGL